MSAELHPAIAAILAVTPPRLRMAMTESGWTEEPPDVAKAMQQAAAVLRWLSDNAPTHDYSEFIEYAWTSADLDALADELTREQRDVIADPGT